ncbi:MAG: hypothetical protein HRT35_34680, partial [Algicola sp.]|nr:hypothetical protein [Algicola sp.]
HTNDSTAVAGATAATNKQNSAAIHAGAALKSWVAPKSGAELTHNQQQLQQQALAFLTDTGVSANTVNQFNTALLSLNDQARTAIVALLQQTASLERHSADAQKSMVESSLSTRSPKSGHHANQASKAHLLVRGQQLFASLLSYADKSTDNTFIGNTRTGSKNGSQTHDQVNTPITHNNNNSNANNSNNNNANNSANTQSVSAVKNELLSILTSLGKDGSTPGKQHQLDALQEILSSQTDVKTLVKQLKKSLGEDFWTELQNEINQHTQTKQNNKTGGTESATYLEQDKHFYLEQVKHQGDFGHIKPATFAFGQHSQVAGRQGTQGIDSNQTINEYGYFAHLIDHSQTPYFHSVSEIVPNILMGAQMAQGHGAEHLAYHPGSIGHWDNGTRLRLRTPHINSQKEQPRVKVKIGRITYASDHESTTATTSFKRPGPSLKLADYNKKLGKR